MRLFLPVLAGLAWTLVCGIPSARAEQWPALEAYVGKCVLVVKAKTVVENDGALSFQVLESWKGKYDPKDSDRTTPEGRFFANEGEHGLVDVAAGQEVVFFFTSRNQTPDGKLGRHSTAFPVRDGQIVYASTSEGLRKEYTVAGFKEAVLAAATKGAGPFAGEPDPEKVALVARERLKGLEPKHAVLKGVADVKPAFETEENAVKSAVFTFGPNALPPDGKNPARAEDDKKPFFYVSVHVLCDFPHAPAGARTFTWGGETYRAWVEVAGSDPELVKEVRKAVDEPLLKLP
jgi:hypothetical protein